MQDSTTPRLDLCEQLIAAARSLRARASGAGTAGNLSVRVDQGYLITPSGVDYEALQPAHIALMDLQGKRLAGALKASSEWRIHQDIYAQRPDTGAVVHTHSPYATALACARRDLPAFHYMVAGAGGASIRCARYATFGSQQLSDHALQALTGRKACLLANHGVVALGANLDSACNMAQLVEALAEQYLLSRILGEPVLLDEAEMKVNLEKFKRYGKQD